MRYINFDHIGYTTNEDLMEDLESIYDKYGSSFIQYEMGLHVEFFPENRALIIRAVPGSSGDLLYALLKGPFNLGPATLSKFLKDIGFSYKKYQQLLIALDERGIEYHEYYFEDDGCFKEYDDLKNNIFKFIIGPEPKPVEDYDYNDEDDDEDDDWR